MHEEGLMLSCNNSKLMRTQPRIRDKIRGYIPFTNWWFVWSKLDKTARSILDLGCGNGKSMEFYNRQKQFYTVGVDGFEPYVARCRAVNSHDVVIKGDVRELPCRDKTYDIVLCLGIIEHLEKSEGRVLLKRAQAIARKQVIFVTDVGAYEQGEVDGNPLQRHKSEWSAKEFRASGFKVSGFGIPYWGGEAGLSRFFPETLRGILELPLRWLTGWFVYYFPRFGGKIICVKNL